MLALGNGADLRVFVPPCARYKLTSAWGDLRCGCSQLAYEPLQLPASDEKLT
jgi:hypothetical protein